jgi:phenylalanyl-tRNA synthetase beta chain
MKISIEWLKDYVDLEESPAQIKQDLSMSGLVVEGFEESGGNGVFEVEVTSNRPDCLSHVGVARELAALYGRPLRRPSGRRSLLASRERIPYSIEVRDADLCPRYVGLVMDRIKVGPSPEWMQKRLEAGGMRPVNNIVDITNYVLLELGHPLHAFDFTLLQGGRIVVARAADGDRFVTLDGVERILDSEMLMINDGEGPVAIGGVMGGLNSEINHSTTTVLLECAYFAPVSVRRTSKKLGLSTEASYRFERGADWGDAALAISRTAQLIGQLAGGRIAGSVQDVTPRPLEPRQIELRRERAEKLLGVTLSEEFIRSVLRRLEFKLLRKGKGSWIVTCPSFRADMELEADLIEEIARFHGYHNIPTTVPAARSTGTPSPVRPLEAAIRRALLGLGYSEAVNLSFSSAEVDEQFPVADIRRAQIRNPLTEETQFLRSTLAHGLVQSAKRNLNRGAQDVLLFEIGKVYSISDEGRPAERNTLGILASIDLSRRHWLSPAQDPGYFRLKGVLESVFGCLRSRPFSTEPYDRISWLNPCDASRVLLGGTAVGILGSLHAELDERNKLRQRVYLAEIDLESVAALCFLPVQYSSLPRFPAVERDFSLLVSRNTHYGRIRAGLETLGIPELQSMSLIDVYEGEKIPAGKVGMTIRLTFLDREKTLTIDRVQTFSDNVCSYLRDVCGAELR